MILYNVTVSLDLPIQEDWVRWMQEEHIPDVLATGLIVEHKFMRMLSDHGQEGVTYCVQYFLRSMDDYERYQRDHAPALQEAHRARYGERALAFRTLLEVFGGDYELKITD